MFDSVLLPGNAPKSRFGAGAVITVLIHAVVISAVLWLSSRPVLQEDKLAEVKFFAGRAPAPAAAPAAVAPAAPTTPKVEKKVEKKPRRLQPIIQPREIPQEKPKELEPEPAPEPEPEAPAPEPAGVPGGKEGGVEGGKEGGVEGGVEGGAPGGVVGGTGTDVLPFGEGMTRPEYIRAPPPFQCPREAREARIDGQVIASCTVTLDGYLKACRIIKSLPFMDATALDLLARWRVGPVTYQGHPVLVNYKIPIRMVCK